MLRTFMGRFSSGTIIADRRRVSQGTFTTTAMGSSSLWSFAACSWKPAAKGPPSSLIQHRARSDKFLTQTLAQILTGATYAYGSDFGFWLQSEVRDKH